MNRGEQEQRTRALSTEVRMPRRKIHVYEALRTGLRRRAENNGEILLDLLFGVFSCLFATTHALFGVYPFSLGLLFAAGTRVLPVFIGGIIGCALLQEVGSLYLVLHILAFVYRVAISYPRTRKGEGERGTLFGEDVSLRALGAAILGAGMALYELILFGVKGYTLLFAAGALLLLPVCTLLFSFFTAQPTSFSALLGKKPQPPTVYFGKYGPFLFRLGGLFLCFSAALSLLPYQFFGLSLSKCVTAAFALLIARRFGAVRGCVSGILIGLAGETVYLPAFGLLGLLSGLYAGLGMPLALGAAVLSGGGYAAYVGGVSGFLAVVPEMTVTALLLWVPMKAITAGEETAITLPQREKEPPPSSFDENESLACLSDALCAVSSHLKEAAKQEKNPTPEIFEELCVGVKEKICRRCPAGGECAENDAVWEGLRSAVIRLSIGEGVSENGTPPCEGYARMLEEIRREAALLLQKKRLGGAKGALSADYALLSEMLREVTDERQAEKARDTALENALAEALGDVGITAQQITVLGKRQKKITLLSLRGGAGAVESKTVKEICMAVCGKSVRQMSFSYENGLLCATAESRRTLRCLGGSYTLAGKEGECAADRAVTVESAHGISYAILCDGMGSGTRAAAASTLASSILASLLSAGVGRTVALALLNNVICTSEEECSVALDLLSLDLYEGRATFLKSGAAASFVLRDGALFRIRSRTIPLGLLRVVDSEEAAFDVREGDVMVLLSDGVLGESEDGSFLREILACGGDETALAQRIVEASRERCGGTDDKTALVLRVLPVA